MWNRIAELFRVQLTLLLNLAKPYIVILLFKKRHKAYFHLPQEEFSVLNSATIFYGGIFCIFFIGLFFQRTGQGKPYRQHTEANVLPPLEQLWQAVETRQKEATGAESVLQKGADVEHVVFLGQPIGKQDFGTLVSWTPNGNVGIDISEMEITKNKNPLG